MSDCDFRLGAYLDGELGPQERQRLEEHLAACEPCRAQADWLKDDSEALRRVLGGLLLHVGLPEQIRRALPEKRQSMVMVRTRGVRRQWALAGFGVALGLAVVSFLHTGPQSVINMLSGYERACFFGNWALMLAAGSMLVWPEKAAAIESYALAVVRGRRTEVGPRERLLVQAVGVMFLCVSTAIHCMVLRRLGL